MNLEKKCILILICFGSVEKSKLDSRLVTFWMMKVPVLGESGQPYPRQTAYSPLTPLHAELLPHLHF